MPGNMFTAVTIRRRSAAHGCANAHPDARGAGDGRDDQVAAGFGPDSGVVQGIVELIRAWKASSLTASQHLVTAL